MKSRLRDKPVVPRLRPWGVMVLESHHAKNFRTNWMSYPYEVVVHYLHGSGELHFKDEIIRCETGDTVYVPNGHKYRIVDDSGLLVSLYALCIESDVLPESLTIDAGRIASHDIDPRQVQMLFRRLLFEQTSTQPGVATMMCGLSQQLLAILARVDRLEEASAAQRVHAYIERLHKTFYEPVDLDAAAASVGLSRRRFTDLFREATGVSWLQYIRDLQLDHAERLLSDTQRTVIGIAFECGFEDLSTFYRAFKRRIGTSPARWREASSAGRRDQSRTI